VIAVPFRRCVDPPASCGRIPNHFFFKVNFSAYGEIRAGSASVRARGLSRRVSLAVTGWPLRRKMVAEVERFWASWAMAVFSGADCRPTSRRRALRDARLLK
jgi:hypothetical protein